MSLPKFQTDNKQLSLLQSQWATEIDPVITNPSNQAILLKNINLNNGVTVVNHKLGRLPQGWRIVDITGAATIYRSAAFNNLTLTLTSNAAVTIALEVF